MLSPKRVKHRMVQRGRVHGAAHTGNTIAFGEYGLVSMEPEWLTARQIEAARIALNRYIKRGGKMWIRIFPDKPYTKKPLETRMGKGKGNMEGWVAVVRPGTVLFELSGVEPKMAEAAMRLAGSKLPIKTKFTLRADTE
jgi:large subunit ribosomal protein L16